MYRAPQAENILAGNPSRNIFPGESFPRGVPPASQRDTHPHTPCTRPLAPPCAVWLARARGRLARRTASTRSGAVALAGPAWPLQGLGWCTRLNVVAAPGWRVCTEARRSFVRLRHRHPRHLRFGRHARTCLWRSRRGHTVHPRVWNSSSGDTWPRGVHGLRSWGARAGKCASSSHHSAEGSGLRYVCGVRARPVPVCSCRNNKMVERPAS